VNKLEKGLAASHQYDLEDSLELNRELTEGPFDVEGLEARRRKVRERVEAHSQKTLMASTYGLRERRKGVEFYGGTSISTQPNWKYSEKKLLTSPVNEKLAEAKKKGFNRLVVKESLIPGDTGWGLFAGKMIREGEAFCSYEGEEVPEHHLVSGYGNKDYVVGAIKNHKTGELVYMDSQGEASCYIWPLRSRPDQ
jgi:hypothetical protein